MEKLTDGYVLASGKLLPCIGYGTWRAPEGDVCANGVATALAAGYRHIDTASIYGNETSVGEGMRRSGLAREDIFLTSKLWNTDQGKERTPAAFALSLKKLGTDYLDLYLIHWPIAYAYQDAYPKEMLESWHILEQLYKEGRIRSIGVSNFLPHHLETLLAQSEIMPMVNQIELHPGYLQPEAVAYCRGKNIILEAWSPLCQGRRFDKPSIIKAAEAHGKTPAQVMLRWSLQMGFVPLPKSVTPARIHENADVFDFVLTETEMKSIGRSLLSSRMGSHPDHAKF